MSTTPKKTTPAQKKYGFCKLPPVDLSKAKIGQRLKLRSGEEVTFGGPNSTDEYPFYYTDDEDNQITVAQDGHAWRSKTEDGIDVIKILPLPKKAAKTKPAESDAETLTSLFAKIAFSNDPAWVKRAVKALQFIEKP